MRGGGQRTPYIAANSLLYETILLFFQATLEFIKTVLMIKGKVAWLDKGKHDLSDHKIPNS